MMHRHSLAVALWVSECEGIFLGRIPIPKFVIISHLVAGSAELLG